MIKDSNLVSASSVECSVEDGFKPLKIAVGLSGGVDSSVAALLLKRAGHNVVALFMQNWHDTTGTLHGDCEWEEDKFVAEMVAKKIGIPFHFVDLSETYRKRVVDYMFSEYEKGRTPNPDVLCNREIKFDAFLQCALELGVDYVATGHYCKKDEFINDKGETIYRILAGDDKNKDQSYFLCQLSQEQLSKALFPIGDIDKPTVRALAKEAGLQSAEKKDSQGICFVGKVDLPVFLQQKLKPKEGKVVEIFATEDERAPYTQAALKPGETVADAIAEQAAHNGSAHNEATVMDSQQNVVPYSHEELEALSTPIKYTPKDGKVIGKHIGAQFYTIGQRKGLNIGGHKESIFVISIDIDQNVIYVGEGHSHPGLYRRGLKIEPSEVHWIREDLRMQPGEARRYLVRIRYRQPLQEATLYQHPDGLYIIFDKPQRGISAGQFAAWYTPGEEEMIGSGVI
ncbi:MAG: tRNA 2-thiouridine(34) synthase MnmA [Bacteroidales bacterium]|nr:tRNA 2-thiouridine(34) synthase MnmA [Bacteroidales bacterium]